ncbi:tRNA (N6-isopentenyl adenosine(37)-C2)-methylthiotransferase MiaB [Ponticaulis sp.]|uniref:tRNA (N6-isopentenyl adenosine(37)-C2)-methylthiotransferase MiaB n=1 Tax=Ponticaulis sp. TaxID=2020902 RepID=UPI000B6A030E|nr:tRNA (N6-isopentenyl adenosine(37)-C2)-methylthiotransferase MiaB [Ponticaulis sp.]MAJ09472.1 tRNA (N6-isopentenyl adenosine(37)-C2)-methylthiotransferase MiaB [Ponticaulis sp.]RPG18818.1 MAG: tRNA (N6-isopentenyl adenosine(37)-C2)-methylthiotransferase MiaB [Hyphomonadaceae bacterium TMED125]HBH91008.1 tRNA (N6-isopentenyl adenosine(37)-C2)-methylthiotransferase MiaB [Hyphomonadaceae bacterium]|tara:strand:- start:5896 stop:7257 length:1362 start_codon:yes stop_codon:yes gene_type:complete
MNAATKRLFIKTYGCQMNVYDSERMKDVLAPLGYVTTETADDADLVLLNTCHIREKATEKVFSELGQLKRLKQKSGGKMLLGVTGCVAQAEGEEIMRRQPAVDLVLGPQAYHKLPEMIARVHRAANERLETDFDVEEKFDALPLDRQVDGPSAFLSVQEGCDKFCTFCVVPYTRGAEFSRNVDAIVAEARALVHKGVREINLLGQNVNAYHGDAPVLEGGDSWTLSKLIRHLAKIDGLDRIRFTTSHPRDMDDDLIEAFGDTEKLMPYLHLPIQAGSDAILKAMNRGHTAERYIEIIDRLREIRPDMAITSDFIVGFPGERDEDFEDTMKLVERIDYAAAYSFKYSRRPGTPASDMFSQVPEEVKDERLQRLQALLREQQTRFNQAQIGKTLPVLVTGKARNEGQMAGRTPYLQATHFECSEDLTGQIVNVTMNAATLNSVGGQLASKVEPVA